MANDTLTEAITLIKAGKKAEAQKLLEPFIEANPHNIQAWIWEAEAWPTVEGKIKVLELCLQHNPDNGIIRQALAALKSQVQSKPTMPGQSSASSDRQLVSSDKQNAFQGQFIGPTILGLIGAIVMGAGSFLPFVKIPIVGSITYFNNGQGDGVIVLGLALVAIAAILLRLYVLAGIGGVIAGALLGYTAWNMIVVISSLQETIKTDLADNPFAGIAESLLSSIQIEFGVYAIAIGVVLVIVASGWGTAIYRPRKFIWFATTLLSATLIAITVVYVGMRGISPNSIPLLASSPVDSATSLEAGWKIQTDISPMDNTEAIVVYREAEQPYTSGYSINETVVLGLICKNHEFDIGIATNSILEYDYDTDMARVRIRFDDEVAQVRDARISTDSTMLYLRPPKEFFALIQNHKRMLFEFTPFQSGAVVVEFNLEGLSDVVKPLTDACPITPQ